MVVDNSGAKSVQCIKLLGGTKRRTVGVGDVIVVSVKSAIPRGKVKKGDVCRAVIVSLASNTRREDGSYIKHDNSAVVLVNKHGDLLGTRVSGAVSRELRGKGFTKILSLAEEVW
jgi:large subunit ribosomal protein L14